MHLRRKLAWISVLYFAEGLPFGLAYDVWPIYFRAHGVSLKEIGLMSLLSLPWTWKILWAPLVDRFGYRQLWITPALAVLGVASIALVSQDAANPSWLLWGALLLFTTASATQDIAIDAYAVDIATPQESGAINGVRVSAARVAMLAGGGGVVTLSGFVGWMPMWIAVAVIFILLSIAAFASPRIATTKGGHKESLGGFFQQLVHWLLRPEMIPVAVFILVFKLGDSTLGRMVKPFWLDRGYAEWEIGLISISLGVVLTIAGALTGGWFTTRYGIFRGLLWMGLSQAVSNLGYVAVATFDLPRESIYVASIIESFTQGLGTAAFMSFLMNLCDKERAATQYALLSALFALARDVVGAFSGIGVEQLGYATYFAVTTLMAVPGLALLPLVKPRIRESAANGGVTT